MTKPNNNACSAATGQALDTENEAIGGALEKTNNTTTQQSAQLPPTPVEVIPANIPEAL